MSEVLDKIMTFINENTYTLIGICIFLILVLIGYLIDNSVKSRKIRKDIRNKNQVSDDVNEEIVQDQANESIDKFLNVVEDNNEKMDNEVTFDIDSAPSNSIDMQLDLNEIDEKDSLDRSFNLDNAFNNPFESNDINDSLSLDLNMDSINDSEIVNEEIKPDIPLSFDIPVENNLTLEDNENISNQLTENILVNSVEENNILDKDPDSYTVEKPASTEYKNSKKLSEILSNMNNVSKPEPLSEEIFDNSKEDIVINTNVKKEEVEIEKVNNPSDELDRIMQKLSKTGFDDNEDNYTNIF